MTFSYDYNQSIGYLTSLASRSLSQRLASRFVEEGIDMTAEQWGALLILANEAPLTQGELAERLRLEKSSVSRLIDRLEKRSWIARTSDFRDSRRKIVVPTAAAEHLLERCIVIAREVLEEAQVGMDEEERRAMRQSLARVIANLETLAG